MAIDMQNTADRTVIVLDDGEAHYDRTLVHPDDTAMVVIFQGHPDRRETQSVVLSIDELRTLQNPAYPPHIPLGDGDAYYMGDGMFVIRQVYPFAEGEPMQDIAISENDVETILRLAA